jgi:hypothetical protein
LGTAVISFDSASGNRRKHLVPFTAPGLDMY